MAGAWGYTCFGIPVASSLRFPGAWRAMAPQTDATIVVDGELPRWGDTVDGGWEGVSDNEAFVVLRSKTGEHRFFHGGRELFHLSADYQTLITGLGPVRDTRWWRILLDSVLFTVSLLRGNEAIHAGAVATPLGAVAVVGRSGVGKSTLVGQLRREGHELVTDDVLAVTADGDQILAHPGPPLMTLPRGRSGGFGTRVSCVGSEVWAAVPVVSAPVPLRRLVLLDRRPDAQTGMHRVKSPLALLLTHLLNFPRTPERELARFSLASAMTTRIELWRLLADVNTSPAQLAALALRGLTHPG